MSSRARSVVQVSLIAIALAVVAVFAAVSKETQGYHRTDIAAALRNIETNVDFPGVYKQAAWAYYRHGQYENAIDIAAEELGKVVDDNQAVISQIAGTLS